METQQDSTDKQYPHCERWAAVNKEARSIIDFIDWMTSEVTPPLKVCKRWESGDYLPDLTPNKLEALIMQFFEVDSKEVEKERVAMLDAMRIKLRETHVKE